ncbi:Aldo/keto reductase, partial [Cristinia sonorae]
YGTMGLSAAYGTVRPDEERLTFLDHLYESGCTFWDTSDRYGDSEDLLGKWFKRSGKRNEIFLASKFGYVYHIPGKVVHGGPEYVPQALDKSLKRLGTEYIDLYYIHRVDQQTPIEHTMQALKKLVEAGKIKHIGISECSEDTLRRAHAVHPIAAAQLEYSPITLDIEDSNLNLLNACRELGIAIVAYSPLGRGVLTGQYRSPEEFEESDVRKIIPRYSHEKWPNVLQLADGLKAIGERHNATAGQVALAWVLAQGEDVIPNPGTRSLKYLRENLGALNINLSDEEINEVRTIAERAGASKMARYPYAVVGLTYASTPPLD